MTPNGVAALRADAELAVAQEPPGSLWRPIALLARFWARWLSGDQQAAEVALDDLIDLFAGVSDPTHVQALAHRSLFAMDRGEWTAAAGDLSRARDQIDALHLGEYAQVAITFAASARLAQHDQDLPSTRAFLGHGMRLRPLHTWASPGAAILLRLELARVLLALADPAGARTMLREIDEIRRHRPDLGTLVKQVDDLRDQLATLPVGRIGVSALTPAELRLLPYLQTHLTHIEIGQRLYVSLNTVRTQTQSIYRKLEVKSRANAVEEARRVGLLAG
jgi:LuxR family maltose regulon positive regulatory protein